MNFNDKILNYAKASYPMLVINTHEEKRVTNDLLTILPKREKFGTFYRWDCITGLVDLNKDGNIIKGTDDPNKLFEFLLNSAGRNEKRSAYVLLDFHLEMDSKMKSKDYIRCLRNLSSYLRRDGNTLIFISPNFNIPLELEKEIQIVEYELPDKKAIREKFNDTLISANVSRKAKNKPEAKLDEDFIENVIEACKGMANNEVESALAFAFVCTKGEFNDEFIKIVFNEKITQIKKNSLLEYIETGISFDNIGGFEGLKNWVNLRKRAFSKEAKEYGLCTPRGIILCGIPGGGKSITARAISTEFKVPLFLLDIGKLFSSHVGDSERNLRQVLQTIESIGKCVVLIDEIEKSLSSNATSGIGDSGVGSRMLGAFLTYLADRGNDSAPFFIGTCNNHLILPPALLRPGRFDAAFWVDLPDLEEREDIFKKLLIKYNRDPEKFSLKKLAKLTNNYIGSEIEELIKSALFRAFYHDSREVLEEDLLAEIKRFKPNAEMYPERLKSMRDSAKGKLQIAGKDGEIIENSETILRSMEI